jgi:thioredoxin reductase
VSTVSAAPDVIVVGGGIGGLSAGVELRTSQPRSGASWITARGGQYGPYLLMSRTIGTITISVRMRDGTGPMNVRV